MTNPVIDQLGTKRWHNASNQLHRDNDLPAIERFDGYKAWYQNGKRHRDNGLPAAEWPNGDKAWWIDDKRHRDNDLPAVDGPDGYKAWYKNGKPHRDNGLPAVEGPNGYKAWWINGKRIPEPTKQVVEITPEPGSVCDYCGSPAKVGLTIHCSNPNCYMFKG